MPEVRRDADPAPVPVREDVADRLRAVVRRRRHADEEVVPDPDFVPAPDDPDVGEERPREPRRVRRPFGHVDGERTLLREIERAPDVVRVLVRQEDRRDVVEREPAPLEPPDGLPERESGVEEDDRPPRADGRAVSRGARAEKGDLHARQLPVLPKPPVPRVETRSSPASSKRARETGATTSCAIRSPRSIVTASPPRLTTRTPTSPR